jgi:hypothetical protein
MQLVKDKVDQSPARYRKDLPVIAAASIFQEYLSNQSESYVLVYKISNLLPIDWTDFFIEEVKKTIEENFDAWAKVIAEPYSDIPDGQLRPFYAPASADGPDNFPNIFSPFHLCWQSIQDGVVCALPV